MANTFTANYAWTKPEVGVDTNAWGGHLNTDLDGIDATVFAVSGVANAAMPKAGGTFTSNVTWNGGVPIISGAAGTNRGLIYQTAGLNRWSIFADSVAESGSNAGSDLAINALSDAGAFLSTPLIITRSTGLVTLNNGLTVASLLTAGGLLQTAASALGGAGFNLPHGVAPTSPVNGDTWSTAAGLFVRINGTTQQLATVAGLGLGALAFLATPTFTSPGAFQAGQDLTAPLSTPTATEVGYMGAPINSQSGNYSLVVTDRGKEVFFTGSATCTIPANGSVPFPLGAATLISADAGVTVTIAITSDTLRFVPSNATGSRTLVGPGTAVISHKKATEWWIKGDVA